MVKKIFLTAAQLKKIPGHSTTISVSRLKGMVAGLLVEAGIENHAIVKRDGVDMIMFEMVIPTDQTDVKRVVHFKLEVPHLFRKFKKAGMEPRYEEAAAWRFFHDYLERRMMSIQLGLTDMVEEFTANMVMMLPDGRSQTVMEAIKESILSPDAPLLPFIQTREVA